MVRVEIALSGGSVKKVVESGLRADASVRDLLRVKRFNAYASESK